MKEHHDISHLSGYQTPAKARYFFEFTGSNREGFQRALQFAQNHKLPILVVAGGKNLLFAFDEYPGLVVYNNNKGFILEGETLTANSGHAIWAIAEELESKHGITLWRRFLGLPGSIGGAVFGNAGCFGLEIGPYVKTVEILDMKTGQIFKKAGEELMFSYRWSLFKDHPEWFLLSIQCDLSMLREKYSSDEDTLTWRKERQPEGLSCGSFFKNPSKEQPAGSLIEQAELKGYHHRGAFFSDKHANFLMSDGTASWEDLVDLIDMTQEKVQKNTGITLEPEVRIIHTFDTKKAYSSKKAIGTVLIVAGLIVGLGFLSRKEPPKIVDVISSEVVVVDRNKETFSLEDELPIYPSSGDILERYETISFKKNPLVDTGYPSWFRIPTTGKTLADWIQALPTDAVNTDVFLYVPRLQAFMPIVELSSEDYDKAKKGQYYDYFSYLESGVLHHASTKAPWEGTGNYVLSGHTSYWKIDNGKYKTVFQFLPLLNPEDEIWLLRKEENDYRKHVYLVKKSYQTNPEDITLFQEKKDAFLLTLYGCYPFGTDEKRWVIQAEKG